MLRNPVVRGSFMLAALVASTAVLAVTSAVPAIAADRLVVAELFTRSA